MHARPLDVLHHARNKHFLAVADGIHLDFLAEEVLVDEHGVLAVQFQCHHQVADKLRLVVDDLHGPATEHVAGTNQQRIAEAAGNAQGLLDGGDARAWRLRDAEPFQEVLEPAPVLGHIDGLSPRTQDGQIGMRERTGHVDGGLSAELDYRGGSILTLVLEDVPDALFIQRLEVEAVAGIEVGGHRLRVGVHDDALESHLLQRPRRVHAAVIELDALSDAYRPAADDHRLLVGYGGGLVLLLVGAVEVGGLGGELGRAGIHGLVDRHDAPLLSLLPHLLRQAVRQHADGVIREAHAFRRAHQFRGQFHSEQLPLLVKDVTQLLDEPGVDARGPARIVIGHAAA